MPDISMIPQTTARFLVPGYLRPADNRILPLLALPFARQRPYWRWPSGKAALRSKPPGTPVSPGMMAE